MTSNDFDAEPGNPWGCAGLVLAPWLLFGLLYAGYGPQLSWLAGVGAVIVAVGLFAKEMQP